jgi:hypothetical protein
MFRKRLYPTCHDLPVVLENELYHFIKILETATLALRKWQLVRNKQTATKYIGTTFPEYGLDIVSPAPYASDINAVEFILNVVETREAQTNVRPRVAEIQKITRDGESYWKFKGRRLEKWSFACVEYICSMEK